MQPLIMHIWNKPAERDKDLLCATSLHCLILMSFACDPLKSVPGAKSWFSSLCFPLCLHPGSFGECEERWGMVPPSLGVAQEGSLCSLTELRAAKLSAVPVPSKTQL